MAGQNGLKRTRVSVPAHLSWKKILLLTPVGAIEAQAAAVNRQPPFFDFLDPDGYVIGSFPDATFGYLWDDCMPRPQRSEAR